MNINDLVKTGHTWMRGDGPDSDIVFSSRVRLARNLANSIFPNRATPNEKAQVLERIAAAVSQLEQFKGGLVLKMDEIDDLDKQFLAERYLVSRELAAAGAGSAVLVSPDQSMSLMINEEDHVRFQVLLSGFRLRECYAIAAEIDSELEKRLEYAYSPRLGYLSACPTNVGTGIRVSAMLHLPALILIRQIDQVLQAIIKLGLAVRGLYGEGTEWFGNLFQISNQVTLGRTEEELITSLEKVIRQVVQSEKNARASLIKSRSETLFDKVGRAAGILRNAHIITSRETIDHLSTLRMGIDLSLIENLDRQSVNELFILTQPAHLQKLSGKVLDASVRDIERGTLLRQRLLNN
ncbi:MAG: protein arginine kinase [Verrucomicrobia bacterium]|nr:protein arginine kinase [Verrucomicrobiota bacterium]